MQAAQAGDQAAYRQVLRDVVPLVRAMARRRIRDADLVEDVVQDTLLTLHRVRHTYDPSRPFGPWIGAIASTRAIDALRRHGRSRLREVSDETAIDRHVDPEAARQTERLAIEGEVARLLGLLPDRQREAVELVKLKEMSIDEAARASRLSVSAFKALLHRALTRLRAHGSDDDARS